MSQSTEPRTRRTRRQGGLGTAFWVIIGITAAIAIGAMGLIIFTPTLANVAKDGISDATSSYRVGGADAYPGATKINMTDTFRANYDRTTRGDVVRSWIANGGMANGANYADKVSVTYGVFATADDINKIEQFYRNQLSGIGYKLFLSANSNGQDQRGFASTTRREVIIITLAKPTQDVLNFYSRFNMDVPKDRNIMTVSAAIF